MPLRQITILIVAVVLVFLVAYDVYAASRDASNTITVVLRDAAKYLPLIVLAWGALTSHLFGESPVLLGVGLIVGYAWNPAGAWCLSKITFWKK